MRYYSDKLKKVYDSPEELEKAEKALEKANTELKKLREEKAARAKEIEDAYLKIQEDTKEYNRLVNAFVKDYHEFHTTVRNNVVSPTISLFDFFFRDTF